jgi:hypothetical protein
VRSVVLSCKHALSVSQVSEFYRNQKINHGHVATGGGDMDE